jgi:hypothetical protein
LQVDFLERYRQFTENKERSKKEPAGAPSTATGSAATRNIETTAAAGEDEEEDCPPEFVKKVARATPRDTGAAAAAPSDAPTVKQRTRAQQGREAPSAKAAPGPAKPAPPAAANGRGWVPEAQRIEGTHVSGYSWVETHRDFELSFELPTGTTPRDVRCEIRRKSVRVSLSGGAGGEVTLLDGPLSGAVDLDGSAWSLERGGGEERGQDPTDPASLAPRLVINLLKAEPSDEKFWGYPMYDKALMENEVVPARGAHERDEPRLNAFGSAGIQFVNESE